MAEPAIRLDRFLWWARLARTRSAAQAIAADGRLRLDGRVVDRAHAAVRIGNVLTFATQGRVRVICIRALPLRRGPAPEAQACYEELVAGPAIPDAAPARLGDAEPAGVRTSRSKPRSIDDAGNGA